MLEQDQLLNKALSVSITMMTRVTKSLSPEQIEVQQEKDNTTRARIKTAFRNVHHAILCIQHLTPSPPWGPSSTTRLLRWSSLGIPVLQTFRLALCKSFTMRDEKLIRQILLRGPQNHTFTSITAPPLVLLQRGCGLRIGFDSWRAEEEVWLSWRFQRVLRHGVCLVEVYMYAREGEGRECLMYWTVEDIAEYFPVEGCPEAVLGDVSGATAERLRGYESEVTNQFEQRWATRSGDWVAV
ncbi:hypothetical protein BKA58DRAFT_49566 [Alternaria rosae]|uniref:uncharacterized protein n=1 Tax=Alternaria rosae TaxID=1187941 RepID=UPI001E8CDD5C|nr:uncharacterized protein BKA58DRAFT_49566 [Alternaria rosae]KAH6858852.1 hypothetical protein BKA58DRAFT_49566 [Alternaria rosae]